jgi:hypothetical protein
MPLPTKLDLENMKQDIDDLANVVNTVENTDVQTRLGKVHKSLTGRMTELQTKLDTKDAEGQAALATAKDKLTRYAAINYTGDFAATTSYEANDVWKNTADGSLWIVPADYTSGATAQADINAKTVRPHQDRDRVESVDTIADLRLVGNRYAGKKVSVGGHTVVGVGGGVYKWRVGDFSGFPEIDDLGLFVFSSYSPDGSLGMWEFSLNDGQKVTPEVMGALGVGEDATIIFNKLSSAVNLLFSGYANIPGIQVDGIYRISKTVEFTLERLVIYGRGKLIKSGIISQSNTTDTDNYNAASIITMAGERSTISFLNITDEDNIDGVLNGYGRAVALIGRDCKVNKLKIDNFVQGIESAWSDNGFVTGAANWSGAEITGISVNGCVVNCRPHHEKQTAIGSGIRLYSSENTIENCIVKADDEYGSDLFLLHGIKIEGLADRHPDGQNLNDKLHEVKGCFVVGPFRHSYYIEGVSDVGLTNNHALKTGRDGLVVSSSRVNIIGGHYQCGGYQDENEAYAIRLQSGRAITVNAPIISAWRNDGDSPNGHHGIGIGMSVGHSQIINPILTRPASVRNKYIITETGGLLVDDEIYSDSGDRCSEIVGFESYNGTEIIVSQGTGWFNVGDEITQPTGDFSATIDAWLDPTDALLDIGIQNKGLDISIINTISGRGVCSTVLDARYSSGMTVRGGSMRGFRKRGINIQDYNSHVGGPTHLIIEDVNLYDANTGVEEGIFIFSFENMPDHISINNNKLSGLWRGLRNATSWAIGDAMYTVSGNTFCKNDTDIVSPRFGEIYYISNPGFKTKSKGVATIQSGTSSVVVDHNLETIPDTVLLTPYAAINDLHCSARNSSNMSISSEVVGADAGISWLAEIPQPIWAS